VRPSFSEVEIAPFVFGRMTMIGFNVSSLSQVQQRAIKFEFQILRLSERSLWPLSANFFLLRFFEPTLKTTPFCTVVFHKLFYFSFYFFSILFPLVERQTPGPSVQEEESCHRGQYWLGSFFSSIFPS
jgi:hypothetical protein